MSLFAKEMPEGGPELVNFLLDNCIDKRVEFMLCEFIMKLGYTEKELRMDARNNNKPYRAFISGHSVSENLTGYILKVTFDLNEISSQIDLKNTRFLTVVDEKIVDVGRLTKITLN